MGKNRYNRSETTFVQRFKSLSAAFCVGFVILEGVLAVLALSIFPVDLILLSSFLSIDLAKEKLMSLHSSYSTPFTEVGKSQ